MTTTQYDAIVVGARCAGAATAMLLARQGARVLLVDSARPGTDTMSTHALMRGAVMLLERWGLAAPLRAAFHAEGDLSGAFQLSGVWKLERPTSFNVSTSPFANLTMTT